MIPFGAGGKSRLGIILARETEAEYSYEKLKPLQSVLDDKPLLSAEFLKWHFGSRSGIFAPCLMQ